MADDLDVSIDKLPTGYFPLWIQAPEAVSQVKVLNRAKEIIREEYTDADVMVLHGDEDDEASAWCEERGWQYLDAANINGCEAKCVVLLNVSLYSEYITRGINRLIIITNNK